MEILSFLRKRRVAFLLLILLPLLAAGITAVVAQGNDPAKEAAIEIALPPPSSPSSRATDEEIANFVAAAEGAAVKASLEEAHGLSADDVDAGLSVSPLSVDGSYVRVEFVSDDENQAKDVVVAVTTQALDAVLTPQIAAVQSSRDNLLSQYQDVVDQVSSLKSAPGGLTEEQLTRVQQRLLLDSASAANRELTTLQAQRDTAMSTVTTDDVVVTQGSAEANLVRAVVINAGIVFLLALAIIVADSLIRPTRRTALAA
jgi:ABC-type Na+ efflux pump permease subunit